MRPHVDTPCGSGRYYQAISLISTVTRCASVFGPVYAVVTFQICSRAVGDRISLGYYFSSLSCPSESSSSVLAAESMHLPGNSPNRPILSTPMFVQAMPGLHRSLKLRISTISPLTTSQNWSSLLCSTRFLILSQKKPYFSYPVSILGQPRSSRS